MPTLLTLYFTTPEELTVTIFYKLFNHGVITTPTAHEVTPIESVTVFIALATTCTHGPQNVIRLAEIGRVLEVDEITTRWTFHVSADWSKLRLLFVDFHKAGAVELFFELGTNGAKWTHLSPTDLYRTGTRNTVTLTYKIDLFLCYLK